MSNMSQINQFSSKIYVFDVIQIVLLSVTSSKVCTTFENWKLEKL